MRLAFLLGSSLLLAAAACGPAVSADDDVGGDDGDDSSGEPDARQPPEYTTETNCTDGVDDDEDTYLDCADADCIGGADCPSNCGELEEVAGMLALPDGGGQAYTNAINFTGFSDGQVLEDITKLLGICVNMEHSWLRDLQMEITCPNGTNVVLNMFLGQTGGEVYMGQPNDTDTTTPVPGVGADYCWSPSAANPPMLTWANNNPLVRDLPTGDYQSSSTMDALLGCPLNGDWTIRVQDLWAIDNGFIFSWSVKFDPSIVEDCSMWPPPG